MIIMAMGSLLLAVTSMVTASATPSAHASYPGVRFSWRAVPVFHFDESEPATAATNAGSRIDRRGSFDSWLLPKLSAAATGTQRKVPVQKTDDAADPDACALSELV